MTSLFNDANKKGNLGGLTMVLGGIASVAILVAVAVLGLGVMTNVVEDLHDDEITATGCNATDSGTCSFTFNATGDGMSGIETFSENLTTAGVVIGAVVLIGTVVVGLGTFVGTRL